MGQPVGGRTVALLLKQLVLAHFHFTPFSTSVVVLNAVHPALSVYPYDGPFVPLVIPCKVYPDAFSNILG